MPKLKSNRAAAKRFKATKNGFKFRQAFRSHILTKKSPKLKRKMRASCQIKDCDLKAVTRLLHGS